MLVLLVLYAFTPIFDSMLPGGSSGEVVTTERMQASNQALSGAYSSTAGPEVHGASNSGGDGYETRGDVAHSGATEEHGDLRGSNVSAVNADSEVHATAADDAASNSDGDGFGTGNDVEGARGDLISTNGSAVNSGYPTGIKHDDGVVSSETSPISAPKEETSDGSSNTTTVSAEW